MRASDWEDRVSALTWSAEMEAYNSSLIEAYEDYLKARTVVWVTSRDEKTCLSICEPMDGVKFDIDESDGLLPSHVLCRCTWAPELEYEKMT